MDPFWVVVGFVWGCLGWYSWMESFWEVKQRACEVDFKLRNLLLIPLWLLIGPILLFLRAEF